MSDTVMRAADAADRLEKAADALLAEVATLPAELISWKPAEDVWSVMEVLCHVAEFVPFWTSQTRQIIAQPDEQWGRTHTDTARKAAVESAGSRALAEVTETIRAGVQASATELRSLRDEELTIEATSRNPRWGLKPASFVIEELLFGHVEKHLGQIRRNAQQFQERGQN